MPRRPATYEAMLAKGLAVLSRGGLAPDDVEEVAALVAEAVRGIVREELQADADTITFTPLGGGQPRQLKGVRPALSPEQEA